MPTKTPTGLDRRTAAQRRALQQRALMAARVTWPIARGWTVAGAVSRVLAGAASCWLGLAYGHMHAVLAAGADPSAWQAAVHTKNLVTTATWLLILVAIVLPSNAWIRTRAYVAKLPGVAPHPRQAVSELTRSLELPAFWPPVPLGQESWTRKVDPRVPGAVTALFVIPVLTADVAERWATPTAGKYEVLCVLSIVGAVFAVLSAGFDVVRLSHYARWPGAAQRVKGGTASA